MNGRQIFSAIPPPPGDLLSGNRGLTAAAAQHYEMVMGLGRHQHHHHHHQVGDIIPAGHLFHLSDSPAIASTTASATGPSSAAKAAGPSGAGGGVVGLDMEPGGLGGGGGGIGCDGGAGRWPRQETLTLLEIRSRLDSKFKEANQKGPLWDEVSRIMCEEHGYQRSGKKCREKFENLYKYYKKTKEGKAGRQDGKHYRFFRQLEALCGETAGGNNNNNLTASLHDQSHLVGTSYRYNVQYHNNQEAYHHHSSKLSDSLTFSNSSGFCTSSSGESDDEDDDGNDQLAGNDSVEKRKKIRRGKRSWKVKFKDIIDSQMRKLMEKQEAWLEKMTKTIENKEQERMVREEAWRKQEAARIDKEHKFWANERAWIEARDAALMEALHKLTDQHKELKPPSNPEEEELMVAEFRSNFSENQTDNGSETITNCARNDSWSECEVTNLVQLRTDMETKFHRGGCSDEVLWEEIAARMSCLGYDRSALMCKDKWNNITSYMARNKEYCGKKAKQNSSRGCCYLNMSSNNESLCCQGGGYFENNDQGPGSSNDHVASSPPPHNTHTGNAINNNDCCFRLLMTGDPENMWQNYGMKLGKGENH